MLNNGGFFGDICENDNKHTNFFTNTDVESVLGKNLVKNFVGKIDFEIKLMGFSETANEIAEYYEECKNNSSIVNFMNNSVIKMILDEMENNFTVKNYLQNRIFDDIRIEFINKMENYYNNQNKIYADMKNEEQNYKKEQILKQRQIENIMSEKKCTKEQAIKYIDELEKVSQLKNITNLMKNDLKNILSNDLLYPNFIKDDRCMTKLDNLDTQGDFKIKKSNKKINKNKNNTNDTFYIDDNFSNDNIDDETTRFFEL